VAAARVEGERGGAHDRGEAVASGIGHVEGFEDAEVVDLQRAQQQAHGAIVRGGTPGARAAATASERSASQAA
jgi:hypothetical protein